MISTYIKAIYFGTVCDGVASKFIDTLTCGISERYSTIAEAFSSPGV
ncbi:MAG: hypothetical protein RXP28_04610 [Nitrososphaeria archaeon]